MTPAALAEPGRASYNAPYRLRKRSRQDDVQSRSLSAFIVVAVIAALSALPAGAYAQTNPATPTPPRQSDGRPDLQGVWNFASATPLQRPGRLADTAFYTEEEAAALAARAAQSDWVGCPSTGRQRRFLQPVLVGSRAAGRRPAHVADRGARRRAGPALDPGRDPPGRVHRTACGREPPRAVPYRRDRGR